MTTFTHKDVRSEFAPYEQSHRLEILNHCVWMAGISKTYSWQAAKHYATTWPELHGDLPDRLIQEMKAKQ